MKMKDALDALSGGTAVDTATMFGSNASPQSKGAGPGDGVSTQHSAERQVSLG